MSEAVRTLPIYTDEDAARAHLEGLLWPNGAARLLRLRRKGLI